MVHIHFWSIFIFGSSSYLGVIKNIIPSNKFWRKARTIVMIKTSVNKINVSNIYELPILYQWLFLDLIQVWVLAVKCPDIFVSWEIYLIETVGISLFTKWLYTLIGVSLEQSYTTQKTNTFENHLCSHQPGTPGLWGGILPNIIVNQLWFLARASALHYILILIYFNLGDDKGEPPHSWGAFLSNFSLSL